MRHLDHNVDIFVDKLLSRRILQNGFSLILFFHLSSAFYFFQVNLAKVMCHDN